MLTHPVTFNSSSTPSGSNATVFPSRDSYVVFDGTNDYVSASSAALPVGSSARSISFWFNPSTTGSNQDALVYGVNTLGARFAITASANRQSISVNGHEWGVAISVSGWNHFVITFPSGSTSSNQFLIYLNGILQSSITYAGAPVTVNTSSSGSLSIGRKIDGTSYYNGRFRDVRIYDDAITANEVTYLYTEGVSGTDPTNTNLVGHWKFDEKHGGIIADSSGNGNDGQVYNITPPAFWDRYAHFDGVNDYINIPSFTITGAFSLSTWVMVNSNSSGWIIHKGGYATADGFGIFYGSSTSKIYAKGNGVGGNDFSLISNNAIPLNKWVHVAFVYDGVEQKMYIDGVVQTSTDTKVDNFFTTSDAIEIGGDSVQGYDLNGRLADIRIYNDALTANEALYLASAGQQGTNPGTANLVGQWKLNEVEGSTAVDSSANSNDGICKNITEPLFWHQTHAYFDGVNDYVLATNPITTSGTAFSVSFWLNSQEYRYALPFVIWDGGTTMTQRTISFEWRTAGQGYWVRCFDASGTSVLFLSATQLTNLTWHHITLTYAGGTGAVKVYVNGTLSTSGTPSAALYTRSNLGIGAMKATSNTLFYGDMSNCLLFNDELTANEALYLATAGEQGTNPGTANLVGQWKLNDRWGTTAFDNVGTNDGTATNITESTFWIQ